MKNMYKGIFAVLAFITMANVWGQYSTADTTALGMIRDNNFTGTTALNWNDPDPANWLGVVWDNSTPKRVITLNLSNSTCRATPVSRNDWRVDSLPYQKYLLARTGNVTNLTGTIDVSALTMLETLMLKKNRNITGINISGLTNLKYLFVSQTNIANLDVSGMTNLIELHANSCDSLTSFDASGCTSAKRLSVKYNSILSSVKLTGCTSLQHLVLPDANLTSLDLTGLTSILRLKIKGNPIKSDSITNLSDLTNLWSISASGDSLTTLTLPSGTNMYRIGVKNNQLTAINNLSGAGHSNMLRIGAKNNLLTGTMDLSNMPALERARFKDNSLSAIIITGDTTLNRIGFRNNKLSTIDLTDAIKLTRFGARDNKLTNIIGGLDVTTLTRARVSDNKLPITLAAQWHNHQYASTKSGTPQYSYTKETILVPDSIDFSAEDSVDINGTMVSTGFELIKVGVGTQGTNSTGIFTLTVADTGCYYVILTNSGATVYSDTICLIDQGAIINTSIDNYDFGSITVGDSSFRTLTVSNTGNIDLNVSNIILPAGFTTSAFAATVTAGNSTTFQVKFAPSAAQTYSGDVSVSSNAVDNAGSDRVSVTGVGIEIIGGMEETENTLSFYPNPTKDILFIKDNTGNIQMLNLYSMEGTLVETVRLTSNTTQIDFSQLNRGIYVIRSADGKINQKVVKH